MFKHHKHDIDAKTFAVVVNHCLKSPVGHKYEPQEQGLLEN